MKVGGDVAGYVSEDTEHPGLWTIENANGRFMGRSATREQGAKFLAAWFVAEEQDWS